MEITKGRRSKAQKIVIYGPEGIGKSSFLAQFPNALFIDTEGSTDNMDVARLPRPSSYTMLLDALDFVLANPNICKTLCIDTADWAERLCINHVCAKGGKGGIEDFGYGNGYTYVYEEWGRFLEKLTVVVESGIHVVVSAHAQLRKFEQPDEMGSYDRYELKLGKKTSSQTAPLIKEWADMVLFVNYKTFAVAVDKDGKKHKAQGGSRMMHTEHHPCWDAKNRHGLPREMPFPKDTAYEQIRHIIEPKTGAHMGTPLQKPMDIPQQTTPPTQPTEYDNLPKPLVDLMRENFVSCAEIQAVVEHRGYFPVDVPVAKYNEYQPGFVEGVLIAAWKQVFELIQANRTTTEETI